MSEAPVRLPPPVPGVSAPRPPAERRRDRKAPRRAPPPKPEAPPPPDSGIDVRV